MDTHIESVLKLVSRPHGAERNELLQEAGRLAGPDNSAVLLWLYDPDTESGTARHVFVLDQYYHCTDIDVPAELLGRQRAILSTLPNRASTQDAPKWGISTTQQPAIREWCVEKGLGATPHQSLFLLHEPSVPLGSHSLIGILQVLSLTPLNASACCLLPYLADGLADTILRNRRRRRLDALDRLLVGINLSDTLDAFLRLAAETVHEVAHAQACLVYWLQPDLTLKTVAASPALRDEITAGKESLTHAILELGRPARIYDFDDPEERARQVGSVTYDQKCLDRELALLKRAHLDAVMGAPIMIREHGVAVIMLLNKNHAPGTFHVARHFSPTDQEVLQTVCDFLAGVIPSVEILRVRHRTSEIIVAGAMNEANTRKHVFDLIAELVPGVSFAALTRPASSPGTSEYRLIGGSPWWSGVGPGAPAGAQSLHIHPYAKGQFLFFAKIPDLLGDARHLALGLQRSTLSSYETQLIEIICKEFSQVLRSEQEVRRELEDLVQIRHAVRSGLTGANGHIAAALSSYEMCERAKFASWTLEIANLGEDLRWANHAGKKMQVMLDQSRFLITEITKESLQVGSHSLNSLILQTIKSVRPLADLRKVSIKYTNRVPPADDQVQIDRQLLEILVFNVLDNAVKYSRRRETMIVDVRVDRGVWKLRVTDFGVHIADEDRDRIFKPFTRVATRDRSTTRPGTGLGLAVARRIARAHGGDIYFTSEVIRRMPSPMAQTRFFVRIPRKQSLTSEHS